MRGYSDEMGGPDSVASSSEWGPLSFGDEGMTAAGLPASPGVPEGVPVATAWSALPSEKLTWEETQHSEMLRHNFLLRRHLTDPGYGASRELSWRSKAANGLGVDNVKPAHSVEATKWARAEGVALSRHLPSSRKPPFGG